MYSRYSDCRFALCSAATPAAGKCVNTVARATWLARYTVLLTFTCVLQEENASLHQQLASKPEAPPPAAARGGSSTDGRGGGGGEAASGGGGARAGSARAQTAEPDRVEQLVSRPELVALRQENANLRTTNELLRRSHETVRRDGWMAGSVDRCRQTDRQTESSHSQPITAYPNIHQQVLRENRQLQAKLERLEGVFNVGDVQLVGDMAAPAAR